MIKKITYDDTMEKINLHAYKEHGCFQYLCNAYYHDKNHKKAKVFSKKTKKNQNKNNFYQTKCKQTKFLSMCMLLSDINPCFYLSKKTTITKLATF